MSEKRTRSRWARLIAVLLPSLIGIVAIEAFFWLREQRDSNWHDPSTRFDAEIGWARARLITYFS